MTWDRVAIVERQLDAYLENAQPAERRLAPDAPLTAEGGLTAARAVALFEDQLTSRQLDVAARELKKTGRSYYTIGSAGHENNAIVGSHLRIDDPAFLHYRSGGFMLARARQLPGSTPMLDTLLGIVASKDDPISQGRHKVWGSRAALGPAADQHDRQPPAEGDGPRIQPGPCPALRRRERPACRRRRRLLVRRCEHQPRHRPGGRQHGAVRGSARPAHAAPPRLRGQRDGDQRGDA